MKNLIKNILKEQYNSEGETLPEKAKNKLWKMFDRIGIEKTLIHLDFELDVLTDLIEGYYLNYSEPKYNPEIEVVFNVGDIASLFSTDMEDIVKNYLNGDFDYPFHDCFDYDSNWMLDDISEENMSFMRKSAFTAVGEDEDEIEEYIGERFGDLIGCAHSEAQQDADTGELHKDIDSEIESFFSDIRGKWSWDTHFFDGRVTMKELSRSNWFRGALENELEFGSDINWDDVESNIWEYEMDNIGYDSVFFPDKMYIDEDKHFRYGGAGNMDKGYLNEMLYDRLQEEIDTE